MKIHLSVVTGVSRINYLSMNNEKVYYECLAVDKEDGKYYVRSNINKDVYEVVNEHGCLIKPEDYEIDNLAEIKKSIWLLNGNSRCKPKLSK